MTNFIILKKQTEYFGIIQKIAHVKHALIRICTVFNFSFAKVNENVFSSEEGDKINFYNSELGLVARLVARVYKREIFIGRKFLSKDALSVLETL